MQHAHTAGEWTFTRGTWVRNRTTRVDTPQGKTHKRRRYYNPIIILSTEGKLLWFPTDGEKTIKVDDIYRHVYATPLKCQIITLFKSSVLLISNTLRDAKIKYT